VGPAISRPRQLGRGSTGRALQGPISAGLSSGGGWTLEFSKVFVRGSAGRIPQTSWGRTGRPFAARRGGVEWSHLRMVFDGATL